MNYDPLPIIGVSLGERWQRTGISVTERTYVGAGEKFTDVAYDERGRRRFEVREPVAVEYRVKYLERHGPPTRYSKVAARIPEIATELVGRDFSLTVDITATGWPTYSLILDELLSALEEEQGSKLSTLPRIHFMQCAITITNVAGGASKSPDGDYLVPRRNVINAAQILFDMEPKRLKIARGIGPLAETLIEEFASLEPKPKKGADQENGVWAKRTLWSSPWPPGSGLARSS